MPTPPGTADGGARAPVAGAFGPLQLLRPEGGSRHTVAWCAHDPRRDQPTIVLMPRSLPAGPQGIDTWLRAVRRAARLRHPNLAEALDIGVHDGWPFVQYAAGEARTLRQVLAGGALPAAEAAGIAADALRALAYAHDGGVVHGDLQPHLLSIADDGGVRLLGLGVGAPYDDDPAQAPTTNFDALGVRAQRESARVDVLALGLVLHRMLSGVTPLDEPDVGLQIERLAPRGTETLRLPWLLPRPVPDVLRAIANRSSDRQERRRYASARSFETALRGWLQAEGADGADPLALLLDRMHTGGTLPAAPRSGERLARLLAMDRQRTGELAMVVLQDPAWAFELLRQANSAQAGAALAADAPVLSVRRAIAMVGIDGVQHAALGLRQWPGALSADDAKELSRAAAHAARAAELAAALRPPAYDGEVVRLVTLLQNLGRLLCRYHFPDESRQIDRLMRSGDPDDEGASDAPVSETVAAGAVLGVDLDALGAAVARFWGIDEATLPMLRRLPLEPPPRKPRGDEALLRALASCANEAADAAADSDLGALERVARRYARVLPIGARELRETLGLPAVPRSDAALREAGVR